MRPAGVESSRQNVGHGRVLRRVERRRAIPQEHALQKLARNPGDQERFAEVFEHAAVGMALVNLDERILGANRSVCNLLGYAENELAGKTLQDITHPEDLETDLEQLDKLLGGEISAYQMEERYIRSNGHIV